MLVDCSVYMWAEALKGELLTPRSAESTMSLSILVKFTLLTEDKI
jgi:hypothetical protein